jgi:hypothetical protein
MLTDQNRLCVRQLDQLVSLERKVKRVTKDSQEELA